jgi:bacterioferritin B
MKISKKLNDAINTQIGEELFASNGYANMAAYFANLGLLRLSGLYFKQSEEEREHALKFVHYLMDVDGEVAIPAIEAATSKFSSLKAALEAAMTWEKDVTERINRLMDLAIAEKDYATQDFLRWYVTEQVEEEANVSHLLTMVEALGERSILTLEAFIPA